MLLLQSQPCPRKNLTLARRYTRQGLLPRAPAGEPPGAKERSESPHRQRLMKSGVPSLQRSEGALWRVERERSWRGTWRGCRVEVLLLLRSHWHGLTPELSRPARCGPVAPETAKRARLERIVRPQTQNQDQAGHRHILGNGAERCHCRLHRTRCCTAHSEEHRCVANGRCRVGR